MFGIHPSLADATSASSQECHHHPHHHHHHHDFSPETGERFLLAILVNLLFVVGEFHLGNRYGSMGLLADAGHNLGDVGGLLISLVAFLMLKKRRSAHFTYGFKKATILATLANSLLLMGAVGMILWECVEKLLHPVTASGTGIMMTAAAGMVVNGLTVFLLSSGKEHDLNVKGAYLHMLADTLVSMGVVVSGGLILLTGCQWLDPVVGLFIAAIILSSSWGVFRESICLALDGVPAGIDTRELTSGLLTVSNVLDVHHLHVWAVSTTENALTAHIQVENLAEVDDTRRQLKQYLAQRQIVNSTLEFEGKDFLCGEREL